jgi:hypothetical protein
LIAILIHTAINFTQGFTSDLFPAAAYIEFVPVAVLRTAAVIAVVTTRGRLGFKESTLSEPASRRFSGCARPCRVDKA